ncbi:DUF4260 domain-containing protein [Parafilimonas sp.]|uniref:DUF4260 domain-containing protein n=1 Tax=Parafilimonas sp. TaxID=1969739 RepID=UPI0039E28B7E
MKQTIRIEEAAMFLFSLFLFSKLSFAWWWFPVLILMPDISFLGYASGNKTGAVIYNIFHHKAVALMIYVAGLYVGNEVVELVGIVLFGHSSMDRFFGYGLKYFTGFSDTHLGKIGKEKK